MTTDQTQGTPWPTDAEREDVAREMFLIQARNHVHPDDTFTPEQKWAEGVAFKTLWYQEATQTLSVIAPHVARRERESAARALRLAAADLYGDERAKRPHAHPLSVVTWLHVRPARIERTQP